MIVLEGNITDAEIKVNDKLYSNTLPVRISNLIPGSYSISITKEEYLTWQKTVQVEPQRASIINDIVLFLESSVDFKNHVDFEQQKLIVDFQEQSKDLQINHTEIFYKEELITRFSTDISTAIIYPDENHIIFQQNDEIRAIDLDGSNNQLLFTISTDQPVSLVLKEDGKVLLYIVDNQIFAKTIK